MAWHRLGKNGDRYWGQNGAGIFFTDGKSVLLLKRSEKGDNQGTWGIPGGKAELYETAIATAQRECREECGQVQGRRIDSLESQDGHHHWTTFFFHVDKPFDCKLSDEHTDWKWVPLEEIEELKLHPKFKENLSRYLKLLERKGRIKKMNESKARTGLKFGYPDGYYRQQYPELYSTPKSATAALDLETEKRHPMGKEQPNGMPKLINRPKGMISFSEWLKARC